MGRKQGCVIKTSATSTKKVMSHDEFMKRVNKSLYFGHDSTEEDSAHVVQISKPLAEYASELFSDSHRGYTLNRLSTAEASSVQTATPATLIMALIYLDRLNAIDPGYVRRITPQELFIVSMMISTKFYIGHDEEIYLCDWATYGNMSEDHLKELELNFLFAIDWNIYISNEQFFEKLTCVENTLARREGLRRGWLTYTELIQMLPPFTLAKFLLNNVTIIAVSYAASVMTIAGALFLASHIPGTFLQHNRTHLATNSSGMQNEPDVENSNDGGANVTSQSVSSTTVITRQRNQTDLVLNVENELLKLEEQYREEELRDSVLQKHNEIATESRLTLPQQKLMAKINVNQKCAKHGQQYQRQGQWFAHKEEYSDFKKLPMGNKHNCDNNLQRETILYQTRPHDVTESVCPGFVHSSINKLKSRNNSTMATLFWHYLIDAVKHTSFMPFPFEWPKFTYNYCRLM